MRKYRNQNVFLKADRALSELIYFLIFYQNKNKLFQYGDLESFIIFASELLYMHCAVHNDW